MDFDQAIEKIDREYCRLGHSPRGYRFLLTSKSNFYSKIVLLSENPGGESVKSSLGHPSNSCENGPAHLTESWKNNPPSKDPLQIQVQRLFQELSKHIPGNHDLIYEALMAYFIPFRSPSFEELHAKKDSIRFSLNLWREILFSTNPKLIICNGKKVFENVEEIYHEYLEELPSVKLNWGDKTGQVLKYKKLRVLGLPHLSRFKIFSRHECKEPINRLLEEATENW